jgi:hypothetical protein
LQVHACAAAISPSRSGTSISSSMFPRTSMSQSSNTTRCPARCQPRLRPPLPGTTYLELQQLREAQLRPRVCEPAVGALVRAAGGRQRLDLAQGEALGGQELAHGQREGRGVVGGSGEGLDQDDEGVGAVVAAERGGEDEAAGDVGCLARAVSLGAR